MYGTALTSVSRLLSLLFSVSFPRNGDLPDLVLSRYASYFPIRCYAKITAITPLRRAKGAVHYRSLLADIR